MPGIKQDLRIEMNGLKQIREILQDLCRISPLEDRSETLKALRALEHRIGLLEDRCRTMTRLPISASSGRI